MKVLETRLGSKSDGTCVYEGKRQGSLDGFEEIKDQSGRHKENDQVPRIGNDVFADNLHTNCGNNVVGKVIERLRDRRRKERILLSRNPGSIIYRTAVIRHGKVKGKVEERRQRVVISQNPTG